jgi:predicted O-linked N-acetylglucosamine transferase (SPINDLY family)
LDHVRQVRHQLPNDPDALTLMARLFQRQGLLSEAWDCLEMVLEKAPDNVDCISSMGELAILRGNDALAVELLERAIRLGPDRPQAHVILGQFRRNRGLVEEARQTFERGMELCPSNITLKILTGHSWISTGDSARAFDLLSPHFETGSQLPDAHGVLLFASHHDHTLSPLQLLQNHRAWAARHTGHLLEPRDFSARSRDPHRRLRIGYVSGDLRRHPVAYFLGPVLEHHDRESFEIFAYSNTAACDDWTERIQAQCDHWRGISAWDDAMVAQQIVQDEIDILIDLSGHTNCSRLLVFARKPAPLQVSWLGYFNTTGMPVMDYLIADPVLVPPDEIPPFVERPLCLERGYLSWQVPPSDRTSPTRPPAERNGYVTYACFNNLAKITPGVVAVWSRLLRQQPSSRLMLKTHQLASELARERVRRQFQTHGVADRQLLLELPVQREELLALYRDTIDIALDPFPYNGGTTTCEALSQGVPVITLRGDRFVSRIGASILTYAGLPELITGSIDDYVGLAQELGQDLPRLAALRGDVSARLAQSALCDTPGFARELESGYRLIWKEWCENYRTPYFVA